MPRLTLLLAIIFTFTSSFYPLPSTNHTFSVTRGATEESLFPSPSGRGARGEGFLPTLQASSTQSLACDYQPLVEDLLTTANQTTWTDWIADLSGERPVMIGEQSRTIATRYSFTLFTGQEDALAYDYILEQLLTLYPESQIEHDSFTYGNNTWKNLILTIPGSLFPEQSVLITAHLDSTASRTNTSFSAASGADDNAAGAAALLEAARLFQNRYFERTIRLIWFTGEEQGMIGSRAYVADHNLVGIQGVINLDMFSYDGDGDRCMELHVGSLPGSDAIGQCFQQVVSAYNLDLNIEYLTNASTTFSDHSSFWNRNIPAIETAETFYYNANPPQSCQTIDINPYYHHGRDPNDPTTGDILANMHPDFGFTVARAALATAYTMAGPLSEPQTPELLYLPVIRQQHPTAALKSNHLPTATRYKVQLPFIARQK